jgi:hypothetical protein
MASSVMGVYLARTWSYHLSLKNCIDYLHIETGHLRSRKHLTTGECVGRNKKAPRFFQRREERLFSRFETGYLYI